MTQKHPRTKTGVRGCSLYLIFILPTRFFRLLPARFPQPGRNRPASLFLPSSQSASSFRYKYLGTPAAGCLNHPQPQSLFAGYRAAPLRECDARSAARCDGVRPIGEQRNGAFAALPAHCRPGTGTDGEAFGGTQSAEPRCAAWCGDFVHRAAGGICRLRKQKPENRAVCPAARGIGRAVKCKEKTTAPAL